MAIIDVITQVGPNSKVVRIPLNTYNQAVDIGFDRKQTVSDVIAVLVGKFHAAEHYPDNNNGTTDHNDNTNNKNNNSN
jgi:hypothetical protein